MLTDADGQFVLFDLPPGRHRLTATKAGYDDGAFGKQWSGSSRTPPLPGEIDESLGQPVVLGAGERRGGITIRLWKLGVVTGRVVRETGEPVVGLQVRAWPRTFVAGRAALDTSMPFIGQTDDRGVYRIPYLPSGEYIVGALRPSVAAPTARALERAGVPPSGSLLRVLESARSADWSGPYPGVTDGTVLTDGTLAVALSAGAWVDERGTTVPSTVFHPAARTPAGAVAVRVAAGEERTGIDLAVTASRVHRLSGRLYGPGRTANVAVLLQTPIEAATGGELDVAAAVTDTSGRFAFVNIPAGSYRLRVHELPTAGMGGGVQVHPGRAPLETMATDPWSDLETWWASADVQLDSDIEGLEVRLERGRRISGVVRFERIGADVPPTGTLRLDVEPADGRVRSYAASRTIDVNERGEFRSVGLEPGRYLLRVSQAPAGWSIQAAHHDGRDLSADPFLVGSADITDVVVTVTAQPTVVSGVVRLPNGVGPDAAAAVVLFPADEFRWVDYGRISRRVMVARAGEDGTYALRGMAPGEYCLAAVDAAELARLHSAELFAELSPTARRVQVAAGSERTVDLVRGTR
jgi:hypothetical protein